MQAETNVAVTGTTFERLARLSKRAPHLRPMAFEALMQMPLALMLAPGHEVRTIDPETHSIWPASVRAPGRGITESSAVLFTDMRYARLLTSSVDIWCPTHSFELFKVLLELQARQVVVDPCTPHTLHLQKSELRVWLNAWKNAPPARDPFEQGGCEFNEAVSHPQVLLDRLDMLFAALGTVERAYLIRARQQGSRAANYRLTLIVDCREAAPLERLRHALPLLGLGLPPEEVPWDLMLLSRHPGFAGTVCQHLTPIHDRGRARWQAPKATPPP